MSRRQKASTFLKECMADALIGRITEKAFSDITINEIADAAGVNRSTWFRHFRTKSEALTYKIVQLWRRFGEGRGILAGSGTPSTTLRSSSTLPTKTGRCLSRSCHPASPPPSTRRFMRS